MTQDARSSGADSGAPALLASRYRLGPVIGTGGMSTVYRARDETLGREVAVKVLSAPGSDPELMKREKSEVALLASLSHHALVTLYDADVASVGGEERSYLVMELVDGPSLDTRIRRGVIPPPDLGRMVVDLAEALHVVHSRGVVHRDIKPANILLAPSPLPGREFSAKLADFGIASLVDSTKITATGTIVGTAAYLSPEQALGQRVGPASDIYSLGLVLLEAATGERQFPGPLVESLAARLNRDPEIPGSLGYEWKSLLTAMTSREPDQRPTAEQLLVRANDLLPGPGAASTAATRVMPATTSAVPPTTSTARTPDSGDARTAILPPAANEGSGRPDAVRPSRRRRTILIVAGAVVLIAVLLLVALALARGSSPASPIPTGSTPATGETTPEPVPSSAAPVAPSTPSAPATSPATVAPATPVPEAPPATEPAPAPPAPTTGNSGQGNGNGNGKGNGNGNSSGKGNGNGK